MTRLDLKRLALDVRHQQARRPPAGSGAMRIVRDNLAAIRGLRDQGATWDQIAAGLASQGVRQRDGKPLTGKRLTALIDSIARQDQSRAARLSRCLAQPDLARQPATAPPGIALSAELRSPISTSHQGGSTTEATIRRERYQATRSLFREKE